jgi:hypothetical protein
MIQPGRRFYMDKGKFDPARYTHLTPSEQLLYDILTCLQSIDKKLDAFLPVQDTKPDDTQDKSVS